MNLNVKSWKEYRLEDLFNITGTKTTKLEDLEQIGSGKYPYVTTQATNNGVAGYFNHYTEKGNVLTIDSAVLGYCSYHDENFSASDHVEKLSPKFKMTNKIALFITTIINREMNRYSYGRKCNQIKIKSTIIKLPTTSNGAPDWEFMEKYIESINHKPITTKNRGGYATPIIETNNWREFELQDIFEIKYGVNMELNTCIESEDEEAINFVARTESNNGVSAKVLPIEGKIPQKAGLITVAGGGSVLSTFLQEEPFYSGRDLYTLRAKENISKYAKLFLITIIKANKYKYNYGRQANKTLPYILLKLPVNEFGKPDYIFMENYIKSLPYGDKI